MWLQDRSGTIDFGKVFQITSAGSVAISFDYFFDTNDHTGDYLQLRLNINPLKKQQIVSITLTNPEWQHIDIVCDHNNDYCCGSLSDIPCSGTLEIVGSLTTRPEVGLMAISNICNGAVITTPTTPTTTTLPPYPATCCDFDSNTCLAVYTTWFWSLPYPSPPSPPPTSDGYYLWTTTPSQVLFQPIYIVKPSIMISFEYYISNTYAYLEVWFYQSLSSPVIIASLNFDTNNWDTYSNPCTSCCVLGVCEGQLAFMYKGYSGTIAIDNVEIDDSCAHPSTPCCDFDDPTLCGYTTENTYGYTWQSSPTNTAVLVPPIGSGYAFFETISYLGPYTIINRLSSTTITLYGDTTFTGNFFVLTDVSGVNQLQINFHTSLGGDISIQQVFSTGGVWQPLTFFCTFLKCCGGTSPCSGIVEITAVVVSGTASYAIDDFHVEGYCPL
ncbi:hypothetical protein CHUAL_008327 [Chamberlinius hualienensis]